MLIVGGVHLGVIEHYSSKVVGHYLNILFLVRNTKHTGIISVVMYLTFIVGLQMKKDNLLRLFYSQSRKIQ